MFIVGLVLGPIIGLLAGNYLFRFTLDRRVSVAILAIGVLVIVFAGFLPLLLRTSLLAGIPLGALLAATPMRIEEEPVS